MLCIPKQRSKQIVMINDIKFPSFTCVRYPTELFELSIGVTT